MSHKSASSKLLSSLLPACRLLDALTTGIKKYLERMLLAQWKVDWSMTWRVCACEAISSMSSRSFMRFCPVAAGLGSPSRVPMFQLVFTIQPFSRMFSLTSRLLCKRKFVWTCKVRPQYSTLHLQIRVNSGNVCPGACFCEPLVSLVWHLFVKRSCDRWRARSGLV